MNEIFDDFIVFLLLYHKSKEIIVYRLTNYVYAISRLNIKSVINLTH